MPLSFRDWVSLIFSNRTAEFTRGANQWTLRRTKPVAKHGPAAGVQRFVSPPFDFSVLFALHNVAEQKGSNLVLTLRAEKDHMLFLAVGLAL